MKKKIVIANWKMNPSTLAEAKKLFIGVKKRAGRLKGVETVICPPDVYLTELRKFYIGQKINFGAQDVFWKTEGSYTGQINAEQLTSVGASYCLVGHSERRAFGDTNEIVNKKIHELIKKKFTVVLCIGEDERDTHGRYLRFLREELAQGLKDVSKSDLKKIVIAYEPIWAIGKSAGDSMKSEEIHEMVIFVRKVLTELYDEKLARSVRVLYGGSVEKDNAHDLISGTEISGFLVGHASLDADNFNTILETVDSST
jgi:triosephosphate isomerase|tara:strand:+ start:7230 stop:7997 length:768 start_codon:yes stop_codon:yes gene_type:complete